MARKKDEDRQRLSLNIRNELVARIDKEASSMGVDRTAFIQMTLTLYFAGQDGLKVIQWAKEQQEEAKKVEAKK